MKYALGKQVFVVALALLMAQTVATPAPVQLDPLVDYAMTFKEPERNADGSIKRSSRVIAAYRKLYPCPSTGLKTGACPGWSLDHPRPLACGGVDAVWNMTWMDNRIKTCADDFCKDRYERTVYGGHGVSKGCP